MAKKEGQNILGQSGNFHRKFYNKLVDEGKLNPDDSKAEQIKILELNYKENGYKPSTLDLEQIHGLGFKKYQNQIEKDNGLREKFSPEEKKIFEQKQANETNAKENRTGKKTVRKRDRSFNKKYEEYKANEFGDASRDNINEPFIINKFLEHLKEKEYKDSTIQKYKEAIFREQENAHTRNKNREKTFAKQGRQIARILKDKRIPRILTEENYSKFLALSKQTNEIFMNTKTTNKGGDNKKFQQMLMFDMYLAQHKGYTSHQKITIHDTEDFFKWLKTDKEIDGKEFRGIANKTCKGYKTAINVHAKEGKWDYSKEIREVSVHKLGVGKAHTKVVERGASEKEIDKALELAFGGKGKTRPNMCVGYCILAEAGMGLRSDEVMNLTYKQLTEAFEQQKGLALVKTKGMVPRVVEDDILSYNRKYLEPFEVLLEGCKEKGLDENDLVFPKMFSRYVHGDDIRLLKHSMKNWVAYHRDEFQDEDRLKNRAITRMNDRVEKKSSVSIKKGDLTHHSFRHAFASRMYDSYRKEYDEKFEKDPKFRKSMIKEYTKERRKRNKDFKPLDKNMDHYINRGYHIYICKQVAEILGHSRFEITENYIITKDKKGKRVYTDLKSLDTYELKTDGQGGLYSDLRAS